MLKIEKPREREATGGRESEELPQRWSARLKTEVVLRLLRGEDLGEVSREFEPSAQTIRNWVKQVDIDAGIRSDGLTSEERAELRRLKRENRQLRMERPGLQDFDLGPRREVTLSIHLDPVWNEGAARQWIVRISAITNFGEVQGFFLQVSPRRPGNLPSSAAEKVDRSRNSR